MSNPAFDQMFATMQKVRGGSQGRQGWSPALQTIIFPMDTCCICGHVAEAHEIEGSTALINCAECETCVSFTPEGSWVEDGT
jgi:hypothetical protein